MHRIVAYFLMEMVMISRIIISLACVTASMTNLTACSTTRHDVGVGTGAVLGGVAGHAITGGSRLGTFGGAAVGGVIGHELSK
jgi:osmotically inducible lipoprotein OsmB